MPEIMSACEAGTKEPPDRGKDGVREEEFPALSGAAQAVPSPSGAAQAAPLYSERLKSNVKFDQRPGMNDSEILTDSDSDSDSHIFCR